MTREEAITIIQKIKPTPCRADSKSTTHTLVTIALDMAIKALEQTDASDTNTRKIKVSHNMTDLTTIPLELERIAGQICDKYCKYLDKWDVEKEGKELYETDICKNCPVNKLIP